MLRNACKLDWSNVEPAIFGTLFERSLDPGTRAKLGAQYTSRADILLVVEPVLMAPLRRRWLEVKEKAATMRETLLSLQGKSDTTSRATRTRVGRQLESLLNAFADEIGLVQVLDPACGSKETSCMSVSSASWTCGKKSAYMRRRVA